MNNQRTPQQASIEARPAREAWERGGAIECRVESTVWETCSSKYPDFNNQNLMWRVKSAPTRDITPGRWRMRNGEVEEVVASPYKERWPFTNSARTKDWDKHGKFLCYGEDSRDLLTRVETRWRPWRPEEVPVWSVVRYKKLPYLRQLIVGTGHLNVSLGASWCGPFHVLLRDWELLLPDGTYGPCGVEEDV